MRRAFGGESSKISGVCNASRGVKNVRSTHARPTISSSGSRCFGFLGGQRSIVRLVGKSLGSKGVMVICVPIAVEPLVYGQSIPGDLPIWKLLDTPRFTIVHEFNISRRLHCVKCLEFEHVEKSIYFQSIGRTLTVPGIFFE